MTHVGNTAVAVGGYTGSDTTTSVEVNVTGGGSPGPWTQAAPVEEEHYGGFMDSDGTFAYEGGGYSFYYSDNIDDFGKFDPVANTGRLWLRASPEQPHGLRRVCAQREQALRLRR